MGPLSLEFRRTPRTHMLGEASTEMEENTLFWIILAVDSASLVKI